MTPTWRWLVTVLILLATRPVAAQGSASAQPAAGIDFFERRVRPVLLERCLACHGPEKHRSGLRLDRIEDILKGGDRGPAVIPGSAKDSPLVRAIRYTDADLS